MNNGSLDLHLNVDTFEQTSTLTLETNIGADKDGNFAKVSIWRSDISFGIDFFAGTTKVEAYHVSGDIEPEEIRILFHNEFVTVEFDSRWMTTFNFIQDYPETITASVQGSGNIISLSKIIRVELSDWREAIWVDMESTSQNAISSVIQQRPVLVQPHYDGSILFFYEKDNRLTVDIPFVRSHRISDQIPTNACSDGIVYYSEVDMVFDSKAAESLGFVTRIYRVPELDTGAMRAAKVMQNRLRQEGTQHTSTGRPNLLVEIDDIARVLESVGDQDEFIVESIGYTYSGGKYDMTLTGRDANA